MPAFWLLAVAEETGLWAQRFGVSLVPEICGGHLAWLQSKCRAPQMTPAVLCVPWLSSTPPGVLSTAESGCCGVLCVPLLSSTPPCAPGTAELGCCCWQDADLASNSSASSIEPGTLAHDLEMVRPRVAAICREGVASLP